MPVPETEPAASAVPAVLPGRPEPARPSVRAVTADEESGITCWRCGVQNRSDRTFCRNDGAPLDRGGRQAPTAARRRGERFAGWRPRVPWKRVLITVGVVAVLVGAAFLTPAVIRAIRDHFTDPAPLQPAAVSASNSDAAHPVQNAFDGVSNSWWGPGFSGDSAGQYLQANYGRPVDLEKIMITPGVSTRSEDLDVQARPERFDLLITDASGRTSLTRHQLADGGPQLVDAAMDDVVQVDVILRGAYGTAEDKQVAIAEVEMFGRTPS
ncbi:discoidin domain-containing protein [Streptomyces sp. NPDC002588]|uniref:discoidin domain-containing protein n=1 Tax=Streptomyces sp. NPDC002588 TaxID=3154419 RepID=UPI003329443C